jgi:hypothetical protein
MEMLRELIPPMLAMEEQQLCRILSTGWRAVLGMDVMPLLSLQTALSMLKELPVRLVVLEP